MLLSVVVPCMNEEDSVPMLVERLVAATDPWSTDREIVLVDDGSTDGTWGEICKQSESHAGVRGLKLSTNRGHQVALTAGLMAAKGQRIFMLDADLQDPPELLQDMMAMMDRGYDVVYGRRSERKGESWLKKMTAHGFYRVLNRLSDVPIPNDTGDFRLVSRRALDAVLDMPERSRFIRGMFAWAGFNQIGIEYVRDPRLAGETKYPMSKMIRLAFDALSSFSIKPLQMATRLAFLTLLIAALMAVYVFWSLILYSTVAGWASTVLVISFFSGIQLLTLGIIGEYLGRLYVEAKGRPLFFVDEQVGNGVETLSERAQKTS
ncbi:putative glycosyltransferase [Ruegeria sp. THAF57]|uniref:glycosyltransferase family 2 protein n=1 Tax=Ruegeria sp. THAF57 TaxID=2744555 RepID=UPI0015DD75C4|nr:glycosyltransferase family 2 protein [Ruegeria sp. THAF57]CAD0183194.1 putative glycosyltransferase [Ruegeria sp. THAF57]